MRRLTMKDKQSILWAMGIFVTTATLAVSVNSLSYGWHWNYSISRYVGLESWSALLFALGNVFVAILLGKYLYTVGETWNLKRWFYYAVVLMAVALIGLSACPTWYFDQFVDGKSLPSLIHEICSRTMFACMLIVAFFIQFCRGANSRTRICCAGFVTYGLMCLVAYFGHFGWFYQMMLVFESCYLVSFMVLCCLLQSRKNYQERSKNGRIKAR